MASITHIPEADRIPLFQKIMFSLGACTEGLTHTMLINVLWMPYFNIGMGLSPKFLSSVLGGLMLWKACTDPIMANLSDNARTRWGRRRPFMVVGAVLIACLYPLFWHMPAGLGESGKTVYLVLVGMAFFTCVSSWAMPYHSLQLELTPNYDERTRLTSLQAFFSQAMSFSNHWVLAIVTGSLFLNPLTGKGDIVIGMRTVSWFIVGAIILFALLPPLFVKERYYEAETKRQAREPFWRSIRESLTCSPLWKLGGFAFFVYVGTVGVAVLSQYILIYYIFDGNMSAASILIGWKGTALVVSSMLLIPLWTWLGERLDKRSMVMALVVFTMLGHLLNLFCLRPDMPYLVLIPSLFEACSFVAAWLFLGSMKADIADYDELQTSRRREGSLNAVYSWFVTAAVACATGLGGFLLEFSGFTAKIPHQPADVLHRMIGIYVFFPIGFWVLALAIMYFYPLSRRRMGEIRAELETRRGAI